MSTRTEPASDEIICLVCGNPHSQSGCTSTSCGVRHVAIAPSRPTLVCEPAKGPFRFLRDPAMAAGEGARCRSWHAHVFPSAAAAGAWIDARHADERWATEPA